MNGVFSANLLLVHMLTDLHMQVLCLVSFTLRCQWTIYLHSNHSRRKCKEKIITWFGREFLEPWI